MAERADWRIAERALWEAALAADALQSMQDEARRVLDTFDAMRRVFATAGAPA